MHEFHLRVTKIIIGILLLIALYPLPSHSADAPSVLLAAVGDVMLARTVPRVIAAHSPAWAWAEIAPLLALADLRFCNLECPVARGGTAITKRYSFRADPVLASQVLRAGGFDIVSLANNHTYDYGRVALQETIDNMASLHIISPGAGAGRAAAIAPRMITCHGLKIAIVAYTWWVPEGYLPSDSGPSPAIGDEQTLADELKTAKRGADLLIVSMHWGREYSPTATAAQRRQAHLAIDAGADLILGTHPHVAEPVEIYHHRPICYSLGNGLFDRSGHYTANGLLVLVRLEKGKVTVVQQVPLKIVDSRPTPTWSPTPPSVPRRGK